MKPALHSPLVLVIDDEEPIRRFLRATLETLGYRVKESGTAGDGLVQARSHRPDLILLDLGLPDMDGLSVTRELRVDSSVPIVVLSARGQELDKVAALDAGADDYLTKPFGVAELTARMRVALRHAARPASSAGLVYEATIGGRTLRVDAEARTVTLSAHGGVHDVRLTPTEFKMLAFLVKHAGKVLTHQQILKEVWGPTHAADVQYLRVYAGQLRQKLEAQPAQPQFVVTEPGVGYRLAASSATNLV
ncbi:MAG: response regulator [Phycisphaerales bacterium]|nr:response regulator [Phycisphaerales bacterium]